MLETMLAAGLRLHRPENLNLSCPQLDFRVAVGQGSEGLTKQMKTVDPQLLKLAYS